MVSGHSERLRVVAALIEFSRPLDALQSELAAWPWDFEGEPAVLHRSHLQDVVRRCLAGALSVDDVTDWAEAIEMRDDIDYEAPHEDWLKATIFRLANREINGEPSRAELEDLLALGDGDIAEIRRRGEAATDGPWKSWVEGRNHTSGDSFIQTGGEDLYLVGGTIADQDFVAHARQDIPKLLAEIERLRRLLRASGEK